MNPEENILRCLFCLLPAPQHPVGVRIHTLRVVFNQFVKFVSFCQFRP